MHNKYILIFLLALVLVSFFLFVLNASLQRHKSFLLYKRKKCIRQKQLNDTVTCNQLKMNWKWTYAYWHWIRNHVNENKFMFGRRLKKRFFSFFCNIVKLIREFGYTFFINIRLYQILNLQPLALFHKNLRSASGKFSHSAVWGNTYAPVKRYDWFQNA